MHITLLFLYCRTHVKMFEKFKSFNIYLGHFHLGTLIPPLSRINFIFIVIACPEGSFDSILKFYLRNGDG